MNVFKNHSSTDKFDPSDFKPKAKSSNANTGAKTNGQGGKANVPGGKSNGHWSKPNGQGLSDKSGNGTESKAPNENVTTPKSENGKASQSWAQNSTGNASQKSSGKKSFTNLLAKTGMKLSMRVSIPLTFFF